MKRFFQWSVLTPYALGALGLLFSKILPEAAFLFGPLMFGGVPYAPFAVALWIAIGRCKSKAQLVALSVFAPITFQPLLLSFIMVIGSTPQMTAEDYLRDLPIFTLLSLLCSYLYVVAAWVVYGLFSRAPFHSQDVAP